MKKPKYSRRHCFECGRETMHLHNVCVLCGEKPVTLEQEREVHAEVAQEDDGN